MQHFEDHLNLLNNLKQELDNLQSYLNDIVEQYKSQIQKLESSGFAKNFSEPIYNKFANFEARINDLQNLIIRHKQIIQEQENKLKGLIQIAMEKERRRRL